MKDYSAAEMQRARNAQFKAELVASLESARDC